MAKGDITPLRKMTAKTIMATRGKFKMPEGENERQLARFSGIVRRIDSGDGQFGPFRKFKGDFVGINLESGEMFKSGTLLLFKEGEDELEQAFLRNDKKPVEFAWEVGIIRNEDSSTGYSYSFKSLTETAANDAVNDLAKKLRALDDAQPKREKKGK